MRRIPAVRLGGTTLGRATDTNPDDESGSTRLSFRTGFMRVALRALSAGRRSRLNEQENGFHLQLCVKAKLVTCA